MSASCILVSVSSSVHRSAESAAAAAQAGIPLTTTENHAKVRGCLSTPQNEKVNSFK